jgi:hypothetical protein
MFDFAREVSLTKGGEIKLTQYPLTLGEIVSWYRSKQCSLQGSAISLVDIQERNFGPKPGFAQTSTEQIRRVESPGGYPENLTSRPFEFQTERTLFGSTLTYPQSRSLKLLTLTFFEKCRLLHDLSCPWPTNRG